MRALVATLLLSTLALAAQPRPDDPTYETRFYRNGALELEAYVFTPAGRGPWPLVVYNHGSRAGQERTEWPVLYIARLLVPAGYAVVVPERRGYGKSQGATFAEEIGPNERGRPFVERMIAEASDVNAAVADVTAHKPVDATRVVMMGYSFGGIIATMAAARGGPLAAVVNQAPGALNWDKSAELRAELVASARKIRAPMWCGAAANDATTESARAICAAAHDGGVETELKIYPPFVAPGNPNPRAPGHALFAPAGVDVWKSDVLAFLASHTR